MKFILLLAVLCLVRAEESGKKQEQSFQIVLVDSKPYESSQSESSGEQKQLKRSLGSEEWTPSGPSGFALPAEAAIGGSASFGVSGAFAVSEPLGAAGAPIAVAGPSFGSGFGPGLIASGGAPFGVSGPIAVSGPGIAVPGPAVAVSGPAAAPAGLYTEANLIDPAAYGSGYAPTYASPVRCSGYTPPHVPVGCEQLVSQRIEITKPVPYPVYKTVAVAVPHPVPYAVPQPVAVKVPHPVPVEVPVAYPVVKRVPYPVEKPVPFPVDRPYPVKIYKKIPVPVPKPYPVEIPILIKKHIHHYETKHSKWGGWD